jgi:tellurite methyltransferase
MRRSHTLIVGTTTIHGFHQDTEDNWVAELACGHAQHVRHRPPWELRPWVTSEAERAQKVGAEIDCPLCQMPTLPPGAREYKRTATFTEATVPAGLLRDHRTKEGTWARIVVEFGQLEYTLESPLCTFLLTPHRPGVVVPTVPHRVKPLGPVRFHVEFLAT